MGKKLTESKIVNILLAILIAMVLWVYVTSVVNPNNASLMVRDVPITMVGEDILNSKGLMIDPGFELIMDINLLGNRNAVVRASTGNVLIAADVSGIDAAGEYSITCKITLPNTVTSGTVTVENGTSRTLKIAVSKMLSKTVEVQGNFIGSVPEGYRTNEFAISPTGITIQGPESVINQVQYAQVTVSGSDLKQTFTGDLGFEYISTQGAILKNSKITANVDTVNVILPVVKTLELPLVVEVVNGGGATADNVEVKIHPETIQISGEEKDITPLEGKSITLGVIDLSKVDESTDSKTKTFPIVLASELTNDSGFAEATVTVEVKDLSVKTLETTNIEIINAPDGVAVIPVTQSLQVRVRGPEDVLESAQGYQLRVVCDLSGQNYSTGQFAPTVKVYWDGDSKAGVIGTYSIVISVK